MKSLADSLPPGFAAMISPGLAQENEADYWAIRDQPLSEYENEWIGFADGVIIAAGKSPVTVLHASDEIAEHSFVT